MHWYSRIELGLPLEEPGRYADKEFWGKNPYDPREPRWRHDYWGDPSKMKDELRREKEPRSARTVGAVVEEEEDDLGVQLSSVGVVMSQPIRSHLWECI